MTKVGCSIGKITADTSDGFIVVEFSSTTKITPDIV
ncbi:hypothetical protein VCE7224_00868 [Vibrio celticus]|uniref:Uncharacterized protein n=1 Tax=Vibrio celticus TaxID=446372 RepID=A0A1C3JAP5_9VIBR|nr:hypothetical protein VCE7224_00868 [Vibrio celticus]